MSPPPPPPPRISSEVSTKVWKKVETSEHSQSTFQASRYTYNKKSCICLHSKICQLCLSEKTKILYRDKAKTIIKGLTELHVKCFHFELDRWI